MPSFSNSAFLATISLLVVAAALATAIIFLVREEYDVIVEAPCDPAAETCFYRDCSRGDCPANGMEHYRVLIVRADDFSKCRDESCLQECTESMISCTEIVCGESPEDSCAQQ